MALEKNNGNNEVQQQELQELRQNQVDAQLEEAKRQGSELGKKESIDAPENLRQHDDDFEDDSSKENSSLDEKNNIDISADDKKRFEDYTNAELQQMREESPYKLENLNADFRERYEAEMYGMSQEEYQDYKAHLSRINSQSEEEPVEENNEGSFNQEADQQRIVKRQDAFVEKLRDTSDEETEKENTSEAVKYADNDNAPDSKSDEYEPKKIENQEPLKTESSLENSTVSEKEERVNKESNGVKTDDFDETQSEDVEQNETELQTKDSGEESSIVNQPEENKEDASTEETRSLDENNGENNLDNKKQRETQQSEKENTSEAVKYEDNDNAPDSKSEKYEHKKTENQEPLKTEISSENPIVSEKEERFENYSSYLKEKLNQIKNDIFETRDAEGNISPELKTQLVNDMKQAFDSTPKHEKGDSLVPEKAEFLKDPPIAENKETGKRYDDVNYDWPTNGGFEGKPSEITPQQGDRFDRLGPGTGRYVAPLENNLPQSIKARGLPYHFTEDDISQEPSYHVYEVHRDFSELQDAINEYHNPILTDDENEFLKKEFQKEFDKSNWSSDEYTHEPGKTYFGNIAAAFEGGGGTQMELPMSVESLEELGMIHEL